MADTATPAKSVSTAVVPPQHRFMDSDRVKYIILASDSEAADVQELHFAPLQKIQIVKVTLANGDVAMATATNTTAIDVDIVANGGVKAHDVAAKAAATALAAKTYSALTVSTTVANTICGAAEQLLVSITKVGTQGACTVTVGYVELAVGEPATDWTV